MTDTQQQPTSIREALDASGADIPTAMFPIHLMNVGIRTTLHTMSFLQGRDVRFVGNTRPLTTPRKIMGGAWMVANALMGAQFGYQAIRRARSDSPEPYGPSRRTNKQLVTGIVGSVAALTISATEAKRGKSFIRNRPISRYGHVSNAAAALTSSINLALAGQELYRRRETWLPQLKLYVSIAPMVAKSTATNLKNKVTGQKHATDQNADVDTAMYSLLLSDPELAQIIEAQAGLAVSRLKGDFRPMEMPLSVLHSMSDLGAVRTGSSIDEETRQILRELEIRDEDIEAIMRLEPYTTVDATDDDSSDDWPYGSTRRN